MFKPFRPPSFRQAEKTEQKASSYETNGPVKRRKLSPESDDDESPSITFPKPTVIERARKPLEAVHNPPSPTKPREDDNNGKTYFSIVWRKVTAKKNKTWEEDGVAVCKNGLVTVYSSKGLKLGSTVRTKPLEPDDLFTINGKDVQIESEIVYADFARTLDKDTGALKQENVVTDHENSQKKGTPHSNGKPASKMSLQDQMRQQIRRSSNQKVTISKSALPQVRNTAFRNPVEEIQTVPQVPSETPKPKFDPSAPSALVFGRPKKVPPGKQIVDVVLDPVLATHLRDHQREGVKFLYECVMGLRDYGGQGCILADDMGLGKTLQTIALIWTLVMQNPIYKDPPVIKKVLIACPVTLVSNWQKEFRKWLGRDRLGVMSFNDEGRRLSMFDGRNFKVMIVGYERLTKIAEDLTRGSGIDLIVCDEGHRLKSLKNKAAEAIETLNTARRVILSGTPIQNDLNEFFAMVNFVNDGVLGSVKAFAKDFEKPIMKSRQPNATPDDIEKGQGASNELTQTTSPFILRRTADILSKHLPTKTEYVLFCRPAPEQANVYRNVLQTPMFKSALGDNQGALQMITILKKLCNSPYLLRPKQGTDEDTPSTSLTMLNEMMPKGLSRFYHNSYASKIRLLDELLYRIRNTTNDKVVLVSNYTATLDLMQNLLNASNYNYRRLDGSVPAGKRQGLVDEFNRASPAACFAFLFSAKAGGMGINLIGGNRLILFDVDWNPAVDDQATARIHREGQKKPCYIYRFLIKGGLEERIWQRQVVKRGLANSIVGGGASGAGSAENKTSNGRSKGKAAFAMEELRDLFRLDESDGLRTHDLIGCDCGGMKHIPENSEAENDCKSKDVFHDVNKISASDSDSEPLRTFSFIKASQTLADDLEEQERSISRGISLRKSPKKRKKEQEDELQELMTYSHIDVAKTLGPSDDESAVKVERLSSAVADECLMNVLKLGRDAVAGGVSYLFMKRSKATSVVDDTETLMEAADTDYVESANGKRKSEG